MTDVNTTYTSLKDAINICLSCIGETPVSSPTNTSTNVVLSKQIIEEVSRDVQSKGWWFNTTGTAISILSTTNGTDIDGNISFNGSIPEEARRYISIRAARVLQSRFVGSEELLKFSFQEEQVSLAILTQAHVRNGGDSTSFTAFPTELKALGIEEVMFLQQSAEEKLLSLRLKTELKQAEKLASEKDLVDAQKSQVQTETVLRSQQALTELENTAKVTAETALIADQEALVAQQALTEEKETLKRTAEKDLLLAQELKVDAEKILVDAQAALTADQEAKTVAEKDLIESQKTQLDAQTAIEATAEKAFYDGVVAGTQNTYRDFAAEMRIMGIQEAQFQGTPAYKKIELLSDATKLRTETATETGSDATELSEVNKVMRFIGEAPVTALNSNSLASECVRLLRDTDKELQGRGWWFNTEKDVELTANGSGQITVPTDALSVELNAYATRIKTVGGVRYLYDLKDKSYTSWSGTVKAKVIYRRALNDTPSKYLEYLSVRVAILLTELYPQSGIDIQRLPKMEVELRAYFKDREADEANYSVFDNYDTASRIGINRNYDLS